MRIKTWSSYPLPNAFCSYVNSSFCRLLDDVVGANRGVLKIRASLSVKAQSLFEVESDNCRACELQKKISKRTNRDLLRDDIDLRIGEFFISLSNFLTSVAFQSIEEIVGFHSLAFTSGHFDVRSLLIFS